MERRLLFTLIACGAIAGWMLDSTAVGKHRKPTGDGGIKSALDQAEARHLRFMREEEKLARDVYCTFYENWGLRPFKNISAAEQRHMDATLGLLEKYDIEDPVKDIGKFTDPALQQLYNDLVKKGLESELDALRAAALIEETDIADLRRAMKQTEKEDLVHMYNNLLRGSERHLNAFVRNIEMRSGETYKAQHLKQKKVDAILGR